jgi:hypothetical protein
MNYEQPYIRYHKDLVRVKLEELDYYVKYIHIVPTLSPSELKDTHFHIHTVRDKLKFESDSEYELYKKHIKKWCIDGELYHPSLPKEKKKKKTEVKRKDLFS